MSILDDLMGEYGFAVPKAAYDKLQEHIAARQPVEEKSVDDDWHLRGYAYASKQRTTCAGCGEHKHTPLRIDAMGGYVCLTCIDQKLSSLLSEFGYESAQAVDLGQLPVVARLYERHTGRCTYRRASVTRAEGEPLVRLADVQSLIDGGKAVQ